MNELLLTKEFYVEKYIQKGCNDFKGLADVSIVTDEDYYRIRFNNCIYPVSITIKEFENYVIDLMVKR